MREKQSLFVRQTCFLRIYSVPSELEAILLEAKLIRLHQPKFNSIQKDDKSSLYITVSRKDKFPVIRQARKTDIDPALVDYYGPYSNSFQTQTVIRFARKIFNFCANPPNSGRLRPCFYYHLGQCSGACVGAVSEQQYKNQITNLKRFLNGQTKLVLQSLFRDLNRAVKIRDFESAARIRNNYLALYYAREQNRSISSFLTSDPRRDREVKSLLNVLKLVGINTSLERIEVYDMATLNQQDSVGSMIVFRFGEAQKGEYRKFKIRTQKKGDPYMMREVLERRFRHVDWDYPDLIILDGGKPQLSVSASAVPARIPVISIAKKHELLVIPLGSGQYKELELPSSSPAISLVKRMRDEAHRFATTYYQKVKRASSLNLS